MAYFLRIVADFFRNFLSVFNHLTGFVFGYALL